MKILTFLLVVFAFTITSCKKDYTCTCTETTNYGGSTSVYVSNFKIESATKRQASFECSEAEVTINYEDETRVEKCELSN